MPYGRDTHKPRTLLIHVHVCLHCGKAFRREEVEGRALTTGLYVCISCGREGPLNIKIREESSS